MGGSMRARTRVGFGRRPHPAAPSPSSHRSRARFDGRCRSPPPSPSPLSRIDSARAPPSRLQDRPVAAPGLFRCITVGSGAVRIQNDSETLRPRVAAPVSVRRAPLLLARAAQWVWRPFSTVYGNFNFLPLAFLGREGMAAQPGVPIVASASLDVHTTIGHLLELWG